MKILGITVLCIAALVLALTIKNYFDSKKPLVPDDYYTGFKTDSELEKKYSGKGDFTVSSVTYKSDHKSSGAAAIRAVAEEDIQDPIDRAYLAIQALHPLRLEEVLGCKPQTLIPRIWQYIFAGP